MESFDLRLWQGFTHAGGDKEQPAVIDEVAIDSRRISSSKSLFAALPGKKTDGHRFVQEAASKGALFALVQKDYAADFSHKNLTLLKVESPLKALQEIAAAYRRQFQAKVVIIAGSYGKTMCKDLIFSILSKEKQVAASPESFNSQIGVPLSLFTLQKSDEAALIEAAISEKGEMDILAKIICPDAAIITHVGKKHQATLNDMQTTGREQLKSCANLASDAWALLPDNLEQSSKQLSASVLFWKEQQKHLPHAAISSEKAENGMSYRILFPDGSSYEGKAPLGFHYFSDLVNISIKASWLLGASKDAIINTLETYRIEPMRTEIWQSPTGITVINDVYSQDPQSFDRSLNLLDLASPKGRRVVVFSGLKPSKSISGADYKRIGEQIGLKQIDHLVLAGNLPFSPLIEEARKHSPRIAISQEKNIPDALLNLQKLLKTDDVVLFKGAEKLPLDRLIEAFNESVYTNQCFINLAAIEENIRTIKKKAGNTRLMVMVKAFAYGTNDVRMSRFLASSGIDILGVSYAEEGVSLRRSGIDLSIFVINTAPYEAAKAVAWGLEVAVSEKTLIEALSLEAKQQNKKAKVHLHINTGMGRLGCRAEDAKDLAEAIKQEENLVLEGVMTHFSCADDPKEDAFTLHQVKVFDEAVASIEQAGISIPWKHAANSSGLLRFSFPQFNMARVGLAVYGLYPSEAVKQTLDLKLAISLVSRVVGINTCTLGDSVSYGRSYKATRPQERIAVLPVGYFDGLHRHYSGKGSLIIAGKKAPMVGNICMDYMMCDVTDIPEASIGDPALIFGEDCFGNYLAPEEFAASVGSIAHELITCLGPRIPRIFIYEEARQIRGSLKEND